LPLATYLLRDSAPPNGGVGSLLKRRGDKGLADHRMSCAHHGAYLVFSFLQQINANEPKNIRLRGRLESNELILNHKICTFCSFMRCNLRVF